MTADSALGGEWQISPAVGGWVREVGGTTNARFSARTAAGASTALADTSGRTPLDLARSRRYGEIVKTPEKAGARWRAPCSVTPR